MWVVVSVVRDLFIAVEVEGTMILQHIGNISPNSSALHSRSYESLIVRRTFVSTKIHWPEIF